MNGSEFLLSMTAHDSPQTSKLAFKFEAILYTYKIYTYMVFQVFVNPSVCV